MIVCYYNGIDYPELIISVSWIIQSIRLSVELENGHMVSRILYFLALRSFLLFKKKSLWLVNHEEFFKSLARFRKQLAKYNFVPNF